MNVLSFFHRPRSAPVARERLQLLLAHERSASDGRSDLLEVLRDEILQGSPSTLQWTGKD